MLLKKIFTTRYNQLSQEMLSEGMKFMLRSEYLGLFYFLLVWLLNFLIWGIIWQVLIIDL